MKFLGATIQVPADVHTARECLSTKLLSMLEKVDTVPITSHQKLLLHRAAICPRLNWDFIVNQLPISWVTSNMESMATTFLKRWVGLARSADTSTLYLPKTEGGLGLPAITTVYRKQQAILASLILTSCDPVVQHTAKLAINKELHLQRPTHTPMLEVRVIWQTDPGATKKSLVKKSKKYVDLCDKETRECQGTGASGPVTTCHRPEGCRDSVICHAPTTS